MQRSSEAIENNFSSEHRSLAARAAAVNQSVGGLGNELGVGGSKHFDPANEDEGCGEPNLLGEPSPEPLPCCGLLVVRAGIVMGLKFHKIAMF